MARSEIGHKDIEEIIDRVLDPDRDPLDERALRCIVLENQGTKTDRRIFIINRAQGIHV